MNNELVLFNSQDGEVSLPVEFDGDTVWLSQAQIAELFGKDRTVITKHINNVFKQGELDKESNVHFSHIPSSDRPITIYNLDVILSFGYRVNSRRGVEFRRWATQVLRQHIIEGHTENQKRLADATLVALTIMIAESRPDEKEAMVSLVLNFLD